MRSYLSLLVCAVALVSSNSLAAAAKTGCYSDIPDADSGSASNSNSGAAATVAPVSATPVVTPATSTVTPAATPAASTVTPAATPAASTVTPAATPAATQTTVAPTPAATTATPASTTATPAATTTTAPSTGSGAFGTCYEPMHSSKYPLTGSDGSKLGEVLDADLSQLSAKFSYIRTYHSQYYGFNVVEYAQKYNLKVYVGLAHYDNDDWNEIETQAAIDGASKYPGSVEAIIVGNEDLNTAGGDKSFDDIINKVNDIKSRLTAAGVAEGKVLVGTSQRISAMVDSAHTSDLNRLVSACDFVGVNIYPFFTVGYDASKPLELLDNQWEQVNSLYTSQKTKLRVTETGWPSAGAAPTAYPNNIPSIENQKTYYNAVSGWSPADKSGPHFWFMAYDRRSDDSFLTSNPAYEQYFGIYNTENVAKF
ncbi:hypothetical protein Gpo141_00004598 [Globisporangium polare]